MYVSVQISSTEICCSLNENILSRRVPENDEEMFVNGNYFLSSGNQFQKYSPFIKDVHMNNSSTYLYALVYAKHFANIL